MFLLDHQHMEALVAVSVLLKINWKCLHIADKELKFMRNSMD